MKRSWGRVLLAIAVVAAVLNIAAAASKAAGGDGKFHVVGRDIVGPDGKVLRIRGVNKSGLEYTPWGYDFDAPTFDKMVSWGVNAVRIPVTPAFAIAGMCKYNKDYYATIDKAVALAEQRKMLVLLSDHFSTGGSLCGLGLQPWNTGLKAADQYNLSFVKAMATRYKNHPYVALDLYNEPHDISWSLWRVGGLVDNYKAVGMQALLDGVRGSGFTGLVFSSGNDWGNDLRTVITTPLKNDKDVVYAAHMYPLTCEGVTMPQNVAYSCKGKQYVPMLDTQIAPALATKAVVLTEFGTDRDFASDTRAAVQWAEDHNLGWMAWLWCKTKTSDFCLLTPTMEPSVTGVPIYEALGNKMPEPPTTTTSSTVPESTTTTSSTTVPESTTTTTVATETTTTTTSTTTTTVAPPTTTTTSTSTSTTSTTGPPTTTTSTTRPPTTTTSTTRPPTTTTTMSSHTTVPPNITPTTAKPRGR